jgi:biopolymer transport protein ExbD
MSTQFIEYFQISTARPRIKNVTGSELAKKEPKQIKLLLSNEKIEVVQGMSERSLGAYTFEDAQILELKAFLRELKAKNPEENSVIIKPYKDVKYSNVVIAIDSAQQKVKVAKKKAGKDPLFRSIAFEPRN